MRYQTSGTCSSAIDIEIKDGVIASVHFTGGCNGNLNGISALAKGKTLDEIIKMPVETPEEKKAFVEELLKIKEKR